MLLNANVPPSKWDSPMGELEGLGSPFGGFTLRLLAGGLSRFLGDSGFVKLVGGVTGILV